MSIFYGPLRKIALMFVLSALFSSSALAHRERYYLEKFPITRISIVRIVHEKGRSFAYVRDPEGYLHHVEVGEYIGDKEGKVLSIDDCGVHLSEIGVGSDGLPTEAPRFIAISFPPHYCLKKGT